jgi:lipoprotein NlpI
MESIQEYQRAAELEPRMAPHLWQLGISRYYAGHFEQGRQQFELHQRVNPHDVENAAWHFICVARADGLEAARRTLINIDTKRDTRIPMAEIYKFYADHRSAAFVIEAAEAADTELAKMYAHLYLGLYYEAADDEDRARNHIRQAAAAHLADHYMHDVAKVHLRLRNWDH